MKNFRLAVASAVLALTLPVAAAAQESTPAPGEFKIPGTDSTLKVYGYVEVDATYDFDGDIGDLTGTDFASLVEFQPLDDADTQKKRLYLTARTSRIGLTTNTPTGLGKLTARVEADFNSPSPNNWSSEATTNGVTFRLRHAYGQLGGLLIGQTWSTFTDLGSLPDTVDFNPHGAFALIRQPMIKYQLGLGPANLALAVENPQSNVTNTAGRESTGRRYERAPDGIASLTYDFGMGHLNARGVLTEYQAQVPAATATVPAPGTPGDTDSKWAWGAGVSGSLKFGPENFVWSVQGGDGIGRYLFQTFFQGAALTTTGDIDTWRAIAYHVGLTHTWIPDRVRSNIAWTQTFIEPNEAILATPGNGSSGNKRVDVLFVNTFVSPVKNVEVGLEYAYGQRRTFARAEGTQHRANALVRFGFY